MTLAGRPDRRRRQAGTGLRWIAIGLVVTVLVLLVDASLNSRTQAQVQDVAAGTWIDRVLPVIGSSTSEGQVVASIWSSGLHSPPSALAGEVRQVASGAAADYREVVALHPPAELAGSAGLLEACLLARSQAAGSLRSTILAALGAASGSATPASPAGALAGEVVSAGSDIGVGDSAYSLFVSTFPRSLGVRMPSSTWASDPTPYQLQAATVFLSSLQSAVQTSPVHRLGIYSLTTSPPPETSSGGVAVLPDATAITVTVVVADVGNQAEKNVTVVASLTPAAAHGSASVRDFVNLTPGQAYTISDFGPLSPTEGIPTTLTVTASAPGTPPVQAVLRFSMPPPATTTTSKP